MSLLPSSGSNQYKPSPRESPRSLISLQLCATNDDIDRNVVSRCRRTRFGQRKKSQSFLIEINLEISNVRYRYVIRHFHWSFTLCLKTEKQFSMTYANFASLISRNFIVTEEFKSCEQVFLSYSRTFLKRPSKM